MYKEQKIGAVVLAYNVEGLIANTIEELPAFVDRVYVVDDGSIDRTVEVVRMIDHFRVTLIQHEKNLGPGAALNTGYQAALNDDMDIIVKVDGDDQMPLKELEKLVIPIVEGIADYAKGDRLSISEYREGMPRFRLFGNILLTWLNRIASGYWHLHDPQNGFTAISKRALNIVKLNGIYHYYGYLNDILIQLNVNHFKIIDIPMPAKYGDEKSSIKLRTYVPKVSLFLLSKFLWRLKEKYFAPIWRR